MICRTVFTIIFFYHVVVCSVVVDDAQCNVAILFNEMKCTIFTGLAFFWSEAFCKVSVFSPINAFLVSQIYLFRFIISCFMLFLSISAVSLNIHNNGFISSFDRKSLLWSITKKAWLVMTESGAVLLTFICLYNVLFSDDLFVVKIAPNSTIWKF